MKLFIQRLYLHLKNMGGLVWVPVAVLDLLYPTLIYLSYRSIGLDEYLMMSIQNISYTYLPFFSVWYVIFALHEYIESDGNELLYVCKQKIRFADVAVLFVLYMINVTLYFVFFSFIFEGIWLAWLMLLCVCFMYFGMAYLLLYASGSVTMSIMVLLIYTLIAVIGSADTENFLLYVISYSNVQAFVSMSVPQIVVGGVCCLIGIGMNRKYRKFV